MTYYELLLILLGIVIGAILGWSACDLSHDLDARDYPPDDTDPIDVDASIKHRKLL